MSKNKKKKGVTLIELVIVMAITVIIISASVIGISSYSKYADFKKLNEYAKTLFTTAQLQLTSYRQMNNLTELCEFAEDDKYKLDFNELNIIDGNGNAVTNDNVWSNDDISYQGSIISVILTADDYTAYKEGTLTDGAKNAVYEMFDKKLYNSDLLYATICIEFSPEDALVYSVLYSYSAKNFSYDGTTSDVNGTVSISNRMMSELKKVNVGFCGVDTLIKLTSTKAQKPVISNVKLNNEDQLTLTFKLSRVEESVLFLNYEVNVCDVTGENKLTINLNDIKSTEENKTLSSVKDAKTALYTIKATVMGDGVNGEYVFPAWYDETTKCVNIVLDAVDLGVTEDNYTNTDKSIDGAFSFRRFGLNVENVYCTVKGSGEGYKTTAKKQSNITHIYFGKYDGVSTYTVENARHLYNIRFSEKQYTGDEKQITYRLASDFSWKKLIDNGALYKNNTKLFTAEDFPVISLLRSKSSFMSANAGRIYTISDLTIKNTDSSNTGLFKENQGTIKFASFNNAVIEGADSVGTVCGVNYGSITDVSVLNSKVSGADFVGGLVGERKKGSVMSRLVNRAEVNGKNYVGGIIGKLNASNDTEDNINVDNCRNFGYVKGTKYVGGITGALVGILDESGASNVLLNNCISSPQLDFNTIAQNNVIKSDYLVGMYVGGIVGYCDSATISDCSTVSEGGKAGFVIGEKFVGGIVGYNKGTTGTSYDMNGSEQKNQANVIGVMYVGGIVGANANLEGELPRPYVNNNLVIRNWVNEGTVLLASKNSEETPKYSGGITGYNAGRIIGCSSDIDYSDAVTLFNNITNLNGDYVGGIAGYNNGTVIHSENTADKHIEIVSYVNGSNYIGGIVGFNDMNAVIRGYSLHGGFVKGKIFVGGFAGLNANTTLLSDKNLIISNPNSVIGEYCVGGIIGGNVISSNSNVPSFNNVQNILGSVSGKEFIGGYIGYNIILTEETIISYDAARLVFENNPDYFVDYIGDVTLEDVENVTIPADKEEIADRMEYIITELMDPDSATQHVESNILENIEIDDLGYKIDKPNKINTDSTIVEIISNVISHLCENAGTDYVSEEMYRYIQIGRYDSRIHDATVVAYKKYVSENEVPDDIKLVKLTYDVIQIIEELNNQDGKDWFVDEKSEQFAAKVKECVGLLTFEEVEISVRWPYNSVRQVVKNVNENLDYVNKVPDDSLSWILYSFYYGIDSNDTMVDAIDSIYQNVCGGYINKEGTEVPKVVVADIRKKVDEIVNQLAGSGNIEDSSNHKISDAIIKGINDNEAANPYVVNGDNNALLISNISLLNTVRTDILGDDPIYKSGAILNIDGDAVEGVDGGNVILRIINGDVYVGGVIGYCDKDSYLRISNIINRTMIYAGASVAANELSTGLSAEIANGSENFSERYSYVGGMTGKITSNVYVENCANVGTGEVISHGTFVGGIAEVNLGIIKGCTVSNIGDSETDFVGGIVGLNLAHGSVQNGMKPIEPGNAEALPDMYDAGIIDCGINGSTVTGKNFVGGIVAVNNGRVDNPEVLQASVVGFGSYIGGVIGYNGFDGEVTITETVNTNVNGNLKYIGGIVGYNLGSLNLTAASNAGDKITSKLSTILGTEFVGGVFGYNKPSTGISGYVNCASVASVNGNVGGIAGTAEGENVTIDNCENHGVITATTAGNAGGIIAEIGAGLSVENCLNANAVTALNGIAGGICGENSGIIQNCSVKPEAGSDELAVIGKQKAGAVCGFNGDGADITDCIVEKVTVSDIAGGRSESCLGGIAGENSGTVTVGNDSLKNVKINVLSNSVNAGGLVGLNKNTVTADTSATVGGTDDKINVTAASEAVMMGNFGGAVGKNIGSVNNLNVYATVYGEKLGGDAIIPTNGYGGIVGDNASGAKIENITFNGYVFANGAGSNISCIGGIAGINSGEVSTSRVGTTDMTIIQCGNYSTDINYRTAYGYIGGIVGFNRGSVNNCDSYIGDSQPEVYVINHAGHTGGIVGRNYNESVVTGTDDSHKTSTGKNWSVIAQNFDNDCGTGGIMGYSASGKSIKFTDNYANVYYDSNGGTQLCSAGFIGRFENSESSDFSFENCNNYGKIDSRSGFLGGFVGTWKFNLGSVINCGNYGQIGEPSNKHTINYRYLKNGALVEENAVIDYSKVGYNNIGSSGFVSRFYCQSDSENLRHQFFTNCVNEGDIYTQNQAGGGIVGYRSGDNSTDITFTNCVNYGYISGGTVGGIYGSTSGNNTRFVNCRNYGAFKNKDSGGIVGNGGVSLFASCLSVGNTTNLGNSTNANNYYLCTSNATVTGTYNYTMPAGFSNTKYNSAGAEGLAYRKAIAAQIEQSFNETRNDYYSSVTVNTPAVNVSDSAGNGYYVSWATDNKVYKYQVSYDIINGNDMVVTRGNADNTFYTNGTGIDVRIPDEYFDNSGNQIRFCIRTVMLDADGNEVYSAWKDCTTIKSMLKPLATPKLYLELVKRNGKYSYKVMISNPEDYAGQGSIRITGYAGGGFDFTVTVDDNGNPVYGNDVDYLDVEANNNILMHAVAKKDGYGNSLKWMVQTFCAARSKVTSSIYTKLKDEGKFSGDSSDSIQYTATVGKTVSNLELYSKVEILAYDTDLNTFVVYDNAMCHVTQNGQDMTVLMDNFPNEMFKVKTNTADDISKGIDRNRIEVRSYLWSSQAFRSYFGYEVTNAPVDKETLLTLTDKETNQSIFTDNTYASLKKGYVIQRMSDGLYSVSYSVILAADTSSTVVIPWVYTVTESGIVIDNKVKHIIQPEPVISENFTYNTSNDSYTFSWDKDVNGNAKYAGAQYNITLYGVIPDPDGITENDVYIELFSDNNKAVNEITVTDNNWTYTKLSLNIERVGGISNNTYYIPKASSCEYSMKLRLPQIAAPTVGFYERNGKLEKNNLIYNISWTKPTGDYSIDAYEICVKYGTDGVIRIRTDDETYLKDNIETVLENYSDDIMIYMISDCEAIVSINRITDNGMRVVGDSAHISVKAIASENGNYRNGIDGVEREIAVPKRLELPSLNDIKITMSGSNEQITSQSIASVNDFMNLGMSLKLTSNVYNYSGKYEITLEIVDGDGNHISYLTDVVGANINKNNPITMSGNLSSANFTLIGLSPDYAGRYLKVALRATADSAISSLWADGGENAYLLPLPRVKVDYVDIHESTETFGYEVGTAKYMYNQVALSFNPVEYSDVFEVFVTGALRDIKADGFMGYDVIHFNVVRNGDGYDIICDKLAEVVHINGSGDELELPYSVTLDADTDYSVTMKSYIKYDGTKITLILTDCDSELSRPTKRVVIRSLASETNRYTDSDSAVWYRINDEVTAITTADDLAAPSLSQSDITLGENADGTLNVSVNGAEDYLIMRIFNTVSGKSFGYGMTAKTENGAMQTKLVIDDEEEIAALVGADLNFSFMYIAGDGLGISNETSINDEQGNAVVFNFPDNN